MELRKKITWFAWPKSKQKCITGVTFCHLSCFSWTKTIISFLFERLLYKKSDYEKKNICWRITSAATSLTTNPPPFTKKKNSRKLNDCQIFNVIKVLGVQKLVFINLKKKTIFFLFFTLAFRKKLVFIILVSV